MLKSIYDLANKITNEEKLSCLDIRNEIQDIHISKVKIKPIIEFMNYKLLELEGEALDSRLLYFKEDDSNQQDKFNNLIKDMRTYNLLTQELIICLANILTSYEDTEYKIILLNALVHNYNPKLYKLIIQKLKYNQNEKYDRELIINNANIYDIIDNLSLESSKAPRMVKYNKIYDYITNGHNDYATIPYKDYLKKYPELFPKEWDSELIYILKIICSGFEECPYNEGLTEVFDYARKIRGFHKSSIKERNAKFLILSEHIKHGHIELRDVIFHLGPILVANCQPNTFIPIEYLSIYKILFNENYSYLVEYLKSKMGKKETYKFLAIFLNMNTCHHCYKNIPNNTFNYCGNSCQRQKNKCQTNPIFSTEELANINRALLNDLSRRAPQQFIIIRNLINQNKPK